MIYNDVLFISVMSGHIYRFTDKAGVSINIRSARHIQSSSVCWHHDKWKNHIELPPKSSLMTADPCWCDFVKHVVCFHKTNVVFLKVCVCVCKLHMTPDNHISIFFSHKLLKRRGLDIAESKGKTILKSNAKSGYLNWLFNIIYQMKDAPSHIIIITLFLSV